MKLDERTLRLILVGASVGANCKFCLETSIALALESGAAEQEIEQAIAAGKEIRQCSMKMDRLAGSPNLAVPSINTQTVACCETTENKP